MKFSFHMWGIGAFTLNANPWNCSKSSAVVHVTVAFGLQRLTDVVHVVAHKMLSHVAQNDHDNSNCHILSHTCLFVIFRSSVRQRRAQRTQHLMSLSDSLVKTEFIDCFISLACAQVQEKLAQD